MPSDDTFKLKVRLCNNSNLGVVKEQVGVAFTYSVWFLKSSGHCCLDNRGSTVLFTCWILVEKASYKVQELSLLLIWTISLGKK